MLGSLVSTYFNRNRTKLVVIGPNLVFFYKALFGHLDLNVYHFVSFVNSDRTRLSQSPSLTLKVTFCKTRTFQASYFNRIVKLWNTTCKILPPTSLSSLSTFKCSIKLMYYNLNTQIFYVDQPCTWTLVRGCSCHRT
jgi:hypothetical protein